jgi:Tfp pilus assembly protein PilV
LTVHIKCKIIFSTLGQGVTGRGILKVLMLRWNKINVCKSEVGDTLIEVTIALSILSFVLISSTAVATSAFRLGQTAENRTQIANVAQEQMEALRSFRDNNDNGSGTQTWTNAFEPDINSADGPNGFHMQLTTGANPAWVPVAGSLTTNTPGTTLMVPTATMSFISRTPAIDQDCGYSFVLKYSFEPLGSGLYSVDSNQITTTLVNLKYSHNPDLGPAPCPQ